LESAKRRTLVLFWLALAGGMMTKGPVGVVVPMLVAMATLLWLRQPRRIAALGWLWGLPLFAVVALPWFLVVAAHFDLWGFFIGRETVGRFFTSVHKRNEPFWFFFAVLPVGLLPWTLLAPLGATTVPPEEMSQNWKPRRALLISWIVVPLVFFSASHSKLHTYILPACVPAALLVAHLWNTLLAEPKQMTSKKWTRVGLRATWLFTALLPLAAWAWLAHGLKLDGRMPPVAGVCAAATTAVVLIAGAWAWRHPARWFATLTVCLLLILLGTDHVLDKHEEALGPRGSFRVIGTALREMAQKEDLVVLATVHMEHYGLSFYANRLVTKRHYGDPPKGIHVLPAPELGLAEPDYGHIWGWAMEGHRIFFVASHVKLDRLLKTAPVPLRQLLATREYVLLSNR
jgi:4-amino-4-deoxy-L-arabinose transferase